MAKFLRTALVLTLTLSIASAYSPIVMAKKDHNNSNSNDDDDKNDRKDKKNKSDNDQSDKSNSANSRQFQKLQSNNQQFKFNNNKSDKDKSDKSDKDKSDNNNSQSQKFQPNNKFQFPQPGQGGPKQFQQGTSKQFNGQNLQKQNIQLQGVKDKPDWIEKSHHDHKDVKKYVVNFGGPEPFSNKWYKDHPKAWHYHHDHGDAWKVVTAAGIVGFLGWEAYHSHGPVVVYQPVPYDTLFVARPGIIIDPAVGEWMPLGQFSLMLGPGDSSTRMLDLAVDRFGHIRGSYYDMVSGVSHNVAGIVDSRTQYAQWSLESNRGMTFYTPLGEMMQPQGLVYVQLPSGERQQWQLVRMDSGY